MPNNTELYRSALNNAFDQFGRPENARWGGRTMSYPDWVLKHHGLRVRLRVSIEYGKSVTNWNVLGIEDPERAALFKLEFG